MKKKVLLSRDQIELSKAVAAVNGSRAKWRPVEGDLGAEARSAGHDSHERTGGGGIATRLVGAAVLLCATASTTTRALRVVP
jgi:hypothetical protein